MNLTRQRQGTGERSESWLRKDAGGLCEPLVHWAFRVLSENFFLPECSCIDVLAYFSRNILTVVNRPIRDRKIMVAIRAVVSDGTIMKKEFLLPGEIVSLLTSMASLPIIAIFFWQRLQQSRFKAFTVASCTLLLVSIGKRH